ncbi:MAG: cobyric acid synthase CobQ, partial [Pseudomonadota bacterium]
QEPGVRLTMLGLGRAIPGDADLVILPGTKSTRGDLAFLRAQGWDIDLIAHHRRGGHVLGICGGYQMLGRSVADPEGIEGAPGVTEGLGLLDIKTLMVSDKRVTETEARHVSTGQRVTGYEIHIGRSDGPDRARPFADVEGRSEGAISADGRVQGSYLHGLFRDDAFRAAWLDGLGVQSALGDYAGGVDDTLTALAAHMEAHLDLDGLFAVAR